MHELTIQRKVEFSDTDMAGIVHFSRLIVFMENAEHAFIEALGASVHMEHDGMRVGWPRVAVEAQFKSPARFNDVVDIHLRVLHKGSKTLTYGFAISVGKRLIGTGSMTSACCAMEEKGPRAIEIPAFIADQIQETGGLE
jgi:YbgC/YbaW family acyl-CoA thioester hydrolase